jgi:hypothetical protein
VLLGRETCACELTEVSYYTENLTAKAALKGLRLVEGGGDGFLRRLPPVYVSAL